MVRSLVIGAAVLALAAPLAARAGTLRIFESTAGSGNTKVAPGPFTSQDFQLIYEASSGEGGGIFGFSELEILPFGSMVIEDHPSATATGHVLFCQAAACQQNSVTGGLGVGRIFVSAGEPAGDNGVHNLGIIRLSAGAGLGELKLTTCNYTGQDFSTQTCDPFVLVRTPEPGTMVLLGAGLAGLAFLRRRAS